MPLDDAEERLLARLDGLGVFLAGGANVVLQLSWPEVGWGVYESTVTSGRVDRHPFKRFRTTIGYLGIALWGPEDLREEFRRAVDRQHRQVRSGADSPVRYSAFDPDLQLWVASCLYYGARDVVHRMHGPLTPDEEETLLRACSRFATTLQVPAAMWHRDVTAFEEYWQRGLRRVRIDPPVRDHLLYVLRAQMVPWPLRLLGGLVGWLNTGFLPPGFRDALGLEWSERDERRFSRLMRFLGRALELAPGPVRHCPINLMVLDIRIRRRLGMKLA